MAKNYYKMILLDLHTDVMYMRTQRSEERMSHMKQRNVISYNSDPQEEMK